MMISDLYHQGHFYVSSICHLVYLNFSLSSIIYNNNDFQFHPSMCHILNHPYIFKIHKFQMSSHCHQIEIHPYIHPWDQTFIFHVKKNLPLIHITIKSCSNFPMSSMQSRTKIRWWDVHAP
jgi:hypothetical protein